MLAWKAASSKVANGPAVLGRPPFSPVPSSGIYISQTVTTQRIQFIWSQIYPII